MFEGKAAGTEFASHNGLRANGSGFLRLCDEVLVDASMHRNHGDDSDGRITFRRTGGGNDKEQDHRTREDVCVNRNEAGSGQSAVRCGTETKAILRNSGVRMIRRLARQKMERCVR